jgi:hypothetical protein
MMPIIQKILQNLGVEQQIINQLKMFFHQKPVAYGVSFAIALALLLSLLFALDSVVSPVKDIDTAKGERKEIMVEIREIVSVLREQNVQQKESDERFEEKFDDVIDQLKEVDDSVRDNKNDIIIMQQKISKMDKTSVYLAMR